MCSIYINFYVTYLHDEDTVRGTYEADRDEWIEYVKKYDPGYFDDKRGASQKTVAWLCAVKLTEPVAEAYQFTQVAYREPSMIEVLPSMYFGMVNLRNVNSPNYQYMSNLFAVAHTWARQIRGRID